MTNTAKIASQEALTRLRVAQTDRCIAWLTEEMGFHTVPGYHGLFAPSMTVSISVTDEEGSFTVLLWRYSLRGSGGRSPGVLTGQLDLSNLYEPQFRAVLSSLLI